MPQTTRGSNIEVPNQKALIQGTNFRGAENEVSGEKAAVRDPSENPEKEKHMSQSQRSLESDDASWVTTPSSAAEEAHLQKLHEDMFATLQHSVEDLNVFEDLSLYLKPKPKTTCKHEDLQTSIQRTVPLDVKSLSDPSVIHRIPFPSTDFNKPRNRFKLDEQNNAFSFYGREHMTPLIERVRKLGKGSTCRELVVIGPQGVGKSHSLAALVAFLRKTGEVTCVYISHANFLLQDAFSCIKSAFLDAFNLDGLKIAEIKKMEKTEQLVDFMREVTSSDTRVLFVIDQVDVLEPQAKEEEDFSNDTKRSVKEILNKLSYGQPVVKGASANYRQGCFNIWDAHDMSTFDLYHGLTSTEMKAFWSAHEKQLPVTIKEQRENIEGYTGCMPLYLNVLFDYKVRALRFQENGGLLEFYNDPFFQAKEEEIGDSVKRMGLELLKEPDKFKYYKKQLRAFLNNENVDLTFPELLDLKYVRVLNNGKGECTSVISQNMIDYELENTLDKLYV